jgi:hypothetical protein
MDLSHLLVFLILLGLAFWATGAIGSAFGIPAPILTVIHVVLVIFAVLWVLEALDLHHGGPSLRLG